MDKQAVDNAQVNGAPVPGATDDEMLIDTSKMSSGQRVALEVTESARGSADSSASFAGRLLMGRLDLGMLEPFPEQDAADQRTGDDLVAAVCALLARDLDAEAVDASRTIPADVIANLRDLGVFRMKVPAEYGGLGLTQVNYNRVLQAIASHCGSTAVLVSAHQSIGVPQPLKMYGTASQKAKFLPMISDGALSAFALTEPGVGSDPAQMATTAVPTEDGTHYVINGEKLWTTNGPIADLFVVMAQTPPQIKRGRERRQITAFIVEARTPGVEVVHRCDFMGLRAIENGVIRFTDVRVPAENVLWGEGKGLKLALGTLNTGRLTLPAACAGIGKQCLSIGRRWGAERVQWGSPIGEHEAGRAKLSDMAATTFAMEAVTWLTSHWADAHKDIRIEAAMAKLFTSEASWRLTDDLVQLRGGRGYERADSLAARGEAPYPAERMLRDGRINRIIEGTSEIMRLFLAREALDPHLRLASDLLNPKATPAAKLRALGRCAAFYARWYPLTQLGRLNPFARRGHGRLGRHRRVADRTARRLATALFHAMVLNGPKLEKKQIVLGHLMDIGTELFAVSATLAYAESAAMRDVTGGDPVLLADVFCRQAQRRIDTSFRGLRGRGRGRANRLAQQVLGGEFSWLEQGIIAAGTEAADETPAPAAPRARSRAARLNGHRKSVA